MFRHGFSQLLDDRERVGFLYQVPCRLIDENGIKFDSRVYSKQTYIKNMLGDAKSAVCDKMKLFKYLRQRGEDQFLAQTRDIAAVEHVKEGELLLFKPTGSRTYGGHGNTIIRTNEQLAAFKAAPPREFESGGIACSYINRPWLHDGKKAHFRMYFLVRAASPNGSVPYAFELWKRGKINHAAEQYVEDHYDRSEIHDTHMKSTELDLDFPKQLQLPDDVELTELSDLDPADVRGRRKRLGKRLVADMQEAMRPVGALMEHFAVPLQEALFGFEIFGIDFMVTREPVPRVILLEVNTRVAYGPIGGEKRRQPDFSYRDGPWSAQYCHFATKYFAWMFERGVRPFLQINPSLQYPRLIDTARRTYIVSGGTGLEHQPLDDLLQSYGFKKERGPKTVGLMWIEKLADDLANFDRRMVGLNCGVKTLLHHDKSAIANKETLHTLMFRQHPDIARRHMAETWNIDEVPEAAKDGVLILRPIGERGSCGRGIKISKGRAEFETARQQMKADAEHWKSAIASIYIPQPPDSPLLLDGKKFHIRMFFVFRAAPLLGEEHRYLHDLWPRGRIVTAQDAYIADDWHNGNVHDTHSTSTTHNMWFPEDLPDPSAAPMLFEQMKTIVGAAAQILRDKNVGSYPESRSAFEVFGCDFFMTSDNRVILLEINDKVGYRNIAEPANYSLSQYSQHWYRDGRYTFTDFSRDYFNWIFSLVLKPLFFPNSNITMPHTCCFGLPKQLLHPNYSDCEQ